MNVTAHLFFTLFLLFLVACGTAENGLPAVQSSMSAVGVEADNKPLDDAKFGLNANANSVPNGNESRYAEYVYLYFEQKKWKYAINNPRSQLVFKSESLDNLQNKHVKFQQVHKGVPVWGREIIVHLDENNFVYSISGEILTGLSMLNTQPAIAKGKAVDLAMQAKQWGGKGWQVKGVELYVFNQNGNNYLVYRLTLTKGLLREFVFMNADDAEIIHRISGTHTTN